MHPVNPAYVDALKRKVKESPYPAHMAMTLADIDIDRAGIALVLGQCHLQPFGIVHGGVLATLIDTATFWAAFLRLPQDHGLVNVDLKLNYLAPVVKGTLRAEGVCIRPGRRVSYCEARVYDEEGTLLTHGTSTLMALPGKGLAMDVPKFLVPDGAAI